MRNSSFIKLALAAALSLGAGAVGSAQGDSGALIDALVRKNILTDQEGEEIRADLVKENAATTAGKINLASSITQLSIYGDLRLRYEYQNNDAQLPPTTGKGTGIQNRSGAQSSRFRFRLRLGTDVTLAEGWTAGFGLQTGQNSDSANQSFNANFSNYNVYISRAWLGYQPTDWLQLRGGRFANPFYSTELVWDAEIHPDGFFQSVAIHKLLANSVKETTSYDKDGNAYVTSSATRRSFPWELTLNLGQFALNTENNEDALTSYTYTDRNGVTRNADATFQKTDAWLYEAQLVGAYKLNSDVKVTFAPGFMFYTNGSAGATRPLGASQLADQTVNGIKVSAYRDLHIITTPGDVTFKAFGLPAKFMWDFAYNTSGAARAYEVLGLKRNSDGFEGHSAQDDFAWLAGVQLGVNKKKGDWSVFGNFRQIGLASVDPNINDSDFAGSNLNTQGIKTGVAYNLSDFAVFGISYLNYWNLRPNLGLVKNAKGNYVSDGSAASSIANLNSGDVLQVDMNIKF